MASGPGRVLLVRKLKFDFSSRFKAEKFEKNADLELAVDCKGLRTIQLCLHQKELTYDRMVDQGKMQLEATACIADKLFVKYRLERFLDCDKLSSIIIEHSGYFLEAAEEAAESLGKLLGEKFASKKQVVEVQYTRKLRGSRYSSCDWPLVATVIDVG
jgi:hypothetical protein